MLDFLWDQPQPLNGDAPKVFGYLSKHVVPSRAIMGISSGIFLGFVLNVFASQFSKSTEDLFVIVFSSSVLPGMIPWFVILLAELRFRKNNPELLKDHPFKLPLYPYSNYFAFAMLLVIVGFMFINSETRVSVIAGLLVLIVAAVVYVLRHGLKVGGDSHG